MDSDSVIESSSAQAVMDCSESTTSCLPHFDLATLSLSALSDDHKYKILTSKPPALKVYPSNDQKRRFQAKWEGEFHWIRYSTSSDGIFCAPCFLFNNSRNIDFITKPFRDWKNAVGTSRGALNRHSLSENHQLCVEKSVNFIAVMEKKQKSIKSQLSKAYDSQVQQNTRALTAIVDIIQFLIKQGLAFRGHRWDKVAKRENGNFSMLINFLSAYSSDLFSHLQTCPRNARYLSPKIQNDFISLNGDWIRKEIVEECNSSLFWSIMVDETTDISTTEQASICVHYVNITGDELDICEDFLGFCALASTDAGSITSAIVEFSKSCGLDMSKLVGKGFDGAANMSGHVSGVSVRLEQLYPKAKYFTHCRNHALNLAIVASCNQVPDIRNFMDTFKEITLFFSYSAKRKTILRQFLKDNESQNLLSDCDDNDSDDGACIPDRKYRGLPVLSDTRWLSRVDSIDCLLKHFKAVCEAVEEVRNSSTGKSANDADSFLKRLLSFEFIVSAVISHHVLAYMRPLTVALQAKNCDLQKAYKMARRLITTLEIDRKEDKFGSLWEKIKLVADAVGVQKARKRIVTLQHNRTNTPAESVEAYYKVAYFYAFLDHTITHLKTRFPEELEGALLATYLIPGKLSLLSNNVVEKIKKEFEFILPQSSSFEQEVSTWKVHMSEVNDCDTLSGAAALAQKNLPYYPNIHAILLLLLTIPVGSCSCVGVAILCLMIG